MKNSKTAVKTVVTIETVKAAFVAGLKGFYTAKTALSEAFNAAVPLVMGTSKSTSAKKKLRDTLIQWGEEAGIAKKTVANTVSGLMIAADLALRKRGGKPPTPEILAAVAELLEFCGEHIDEGDLTQVLRLALEQVREGGSDAGE